MNNSITEWINNPDRIYAYGVSLLEAYGGNPNLVRVFANRSPRFAMNDLVAEVRRLTPRQPISDIKAVQQKPSVPIVASEAKRLVHEAWVKLSKYHRALYDTGSGNCDKEVAERLRILKEREPLIERYNSLYTAKEAFFAGSIDEAELQRVIDGASFEEARQNSLQPDQSGLVNLSDVALLKKIHAAKTAVNRCKNQLLYQQDKAAAQPNPMPDCPRRNEVAARQRQKETELHVFESERERRGL